ncbi:sugar ABC transporter, sugar-binding protein [Brachybacterium faecium]|uniref:ABC-type sugar transport system, periplasmic component n=1 Tax=Brachybacterium faecium (strain ATCC 43885 / DSM 4810 / JCM 11609 / LMG 19847 / NBRC 14762 / NCIMB 9860 / 6-10) TaxID=446465 RepID=C7MG93_BRAFD|nr:sugar ABC transporter substrate-binding protein [Brachybacterium faecium]ACU86326.1 ABC-type sugar transport system, periplasmic component [Brachybacterium faecium DSM 4810]SLM92014.1 sugar ABC transporter, sugar-binding protein [Brachybacterium faecium]HJG52002.1 sugar ABC transporter substrate-binding protein [Brachybacterium faecium]
MITRRHALAAGAAGSASLALAACGGDSGGSGGEVDGEGKTLTFWLMEGTNASADTYIEELKEAFTEATGATLDVQVQPWDGAHDKFVTAMAGGTGPDVAEVGTTWVPEFADAGGIDDLTEDIEAAGLVDGLVEGLVEAGTLDGAMYGMPWYAGVRSILANRDMLEEAGVNSQPQNWDELLTMITALEEHNPDWISFPVLGVSIFPAVSFIWGAGGLIAEEQDGAWKATINAPGAVEGLTWYTDLALKHNSSTAAATTWMETDALAAFLQEKVPMFISGSWTPATIRQDNPELGEKLVAFTLPSKDGAVAPSFLGGSLMCRFTETQEPELAFELIKLITTGDFATRWAEETNYFPGTTDAVDEVVAGGDELTEVFATQMVEGGRPVPVTPAWGKIEGAKTISTLLGDILGGTPVQEAADAAAAEMDGFFSE